ncbi:MAG: 5-methyltetrahydropteroyltriglutamate--homocysteine S-methyltransferase [Succinatimonas sp.]|nr:5-methyltetrahydropteroyltriglutamate--homocysteine S-methyltransferase [Succinatimonas sp.]MCI7024944.1 5-methyltetrahydropteroyltriglutamate--homocysteine S-methyltransferase [Succinatimonas sp.]MDD6755716.1 5-methyltetrahydropteroyltriglutamate--homocysteine S-methyltransferase [Succinatimonas sp.]HJI58580.1 5-methyltetrahydropteroyltriglutamate--homocysteine S-methyltransferase [Succinivibrionaceae bacterium]
MSTSVIGYPRIGSLRELKFALEAYFKGEKTEDEIKALAKELRKEHLTTQKNAGIEFISSNDFSFYDNTLDQAVLINIVPKRYRELELSELEKYFAIARGYQGKKGNVKALAMKKWFNTNYHYIVPEFEDDTKIELVGTKPFDEYTEAKQLGIETKPVLIGPFTLLKLIRFTGKKGILDVKADFIKVYTEILKKFINLGTQWVQFDEPYLVHDLTANDLRLFQDLYSAILNKKEKTKILLQTYFGDVRDIYTVLQTLNFDGIGLDFVEGRKTLDLVKEHGFSPVKRLFAGVVNGKNIWKNNYEKTLSILNSLKEKEIQTVVSTSCSLLHVPYSVENETKLEDKYKKHFAFAKEKLTELKEIDEIFSSANYKNNEKYQQNVALFNEDRNAFNAAVDARVKAITPKDFVRQPEFAQREKIQKDEFKLPLFPTTTIGSFPQTAEVRANRKAFRTGEISKEQYIEFNKKKIAECIALQEDLGLDVLVHGEFERNDMVEYFGQHLEGYLFTEKAWVQSYGTRCVKPPVIWGDISRAHPITVDWSVYAQSITDKPLKGMLTGPVTILNWSFPREDIPIKQSVLQLALALRDEVLDLEKRGIKIIQIDEAALREKLPLRKSDWYSEYLDFAIPSFRLVHSGVKATTQIHTHMCYSEFTDIIPAIDDMDADVISFEASRSDLLILDSLKKNNFKTEVGPGVYDIHSPRIPSKEEIKVVLEKILKKVAPEKLWVNPDCGLKTRQDKEVKPSLKNLVDAAKELRNEYSRSL